MAADWRITTLDQLGRIVTGKTPPSTLDNAFGGEIPFVTPSDMDERRTIAYTARSLTAVGAAAVKAALIPKDAVMVSCIGSDMGKAAMAGTNCVTNQQINSIIIETEDFPLYVYYHLSKRKAEIRGSASGSAQPILNKSSFGQLAIELPSAPEQRAIAHILGTLDDKIELNRRMNETLEAIARAIFQSWFINFDAVRAKASGEPPDSICRRLGLTPDLIALFPDRLVDSELDKIPEGWNISTIEELALKVGMGPFGSNIKISTFVSQGIPVISGQHLNDTMLEENSFNFVTTEHADRLASANVRRGDLVFTHAGNIGQVSHIPDHSQYERYVLSQRQFYMRCDLSKVSPIFMTYYFRSPLGQHTLLANASQVGVPSIARPVSYLKSIRLVVPSKQLADEFDKLVRSFHHLISTARAEIVVLTGLRDTLLPKLLSGELRVSMEGAA